MNRGIYLLATSVAIGCIALGWGIVTNNDTAETTPVAESEPVIEMSSIVVASKYIEKGELLSLENLTIVDWPKQDIPFGGYATLESLGITPDSPRQALTEIETGMPVLDSRLSIRGAQHSMLKRLGAGKRAYSIRVDEVSGVAGFVLPGASVDVLHTQQEKDQPVITKVLLTGIEVLAVDRNYDVLSEEPAIANTATLAVTLDQARQLSMAAQEGRLSLALIGQNGAEDNTMSTLTADLSEELRAEPPAAKRKVADRQGPQKSNFRSVRSTRSNVSKVTVVLGAESTQESVPSSSQDQEQKKITLSKLMP